MPFRRTVNITGLSTSDPLPGTPSEIEFTPGSTGGGSSVGPNGLLSFYADAPSTITEGSTRHDGVLVTAWNSAASASGTPLVVADTVRGGRCIRSSTSATLSTAASSAAFLSEGPSTAILVWRSRKYSPAGEAIVLDSTENGTKKGWQLRVYDDDSNIFKLRIFGIRVWDGASWVVDLSGSQTLCHFIPQKWHVVVARLSSTGLSVRVDGQNVHVAPEAISWSYLTGSNGVFTIGGGQFDFQAIELYDSFFTDTACASAEARLAARFGVDLVTHVRGDLAVAHSDMFPYLSPLPNGNLRATIFSGLTEGPDNGNIVVDCFSTDDGETYGTQRTILTSDSSSRVSDVHTSDPLSDNSIIESWYTYDGIGFPNGGFWWRRSTDNGVTWGSTNHIAMQVSATAAATGAPIVEDPSNPGHYYWPVYTLEGSDTVYSAWVLRSTNSGASWTWTLIASGVAATHSYEEPYLMFDAAIGGIFAWIRDGVAIRMYMSRSTDGGATWATPVNSTLQANSAGQGLRKSSTGRYIWWAGRPRKSGFQEDGTVYWRAAGQAWNSTAWHDVVDAPCLDAFYGGVSYGGAWETSPGVWAVIYGVAHDTTFNAVNSRANFYEWYLDRQMPGAVTPSTSPVTALQTLQLAVTGAGDFVWSVSGTSGGSVNSSTGVYTAGASNGTDTVTATDLNGYAVGACVVTVTGGSSALDPATIIGATSVYRADHATNTGNGTAITAWPDELGLRNLVQPTGAQRLIYNTVGINGGPDTSSSNQGMYSNQTSLGSTALTIGAYFSTTSVLTGRFLFGSAYNDTHYDLRSDFTNPGQMMFRVQTGTVATTTIKSDSTALNDGNAHTVIGTWDGTTMKMYIDGVLQAQTAGITGTIIPPSTNNDYNSIGTALDNTNAPFSGWFGDIKGANSASTAINATDAGRVHAWYTALP